MGSRTLDIKNCARCGNEHLQLLFLPFGRQTGDLLDISDDRFLNKRFSFTHWADCPITNEPILLATYEGGGQE